MNTKPIYGLLILSLFLLSPGCESTGETPENQTIPEALQEIRKNDLQGNYETVLEQTDRYLSGNQSGTYRGEVQFRKGYALLRTNQLDRASETAREALEQSNPERVTAALYYLLGEIAWKKEEYGKAVRHVDNALERLERSPNAGHWIHKPYLLYRKGYAQLRNGLHRKGMSTWNQLLESFPDSSRAEQVREIQPMIREGFTVQVGAFQNRENALSLAGRVREKGFAVRIDKIQQPDHTLYAVRAGQFSDRQRAVRQARKLREASFDSVIYP